MDSLAEITGEFQLGSEIDDIAAVTGAEIVPVIVLNEKTGRIGSACPERRNHPAGDA